MTRNAIRTTMLAVALIGAPAAVADYAAGQQAWDAGRPAKAVSEWRVAADVGDRRAMLALGRWYAQGLGVVQDYVEAHKWLNLAASLGEAAAVEERDALAARMTPQQVATAQERAAAWRPGAEAAGTRFRDCDDCPELVVVPAGSFNMGSPKSEAGRLDNEGPVHRVRIEHPFAVGVYEVTRGEYSRFVSATGYSSGDSCWTFEGGEWEERRGRDWRSPGYQQTDAHPVVCVSWDDAKAYVRWLSERTEKAYRLLSESEWEYMARGGTKKARYWGKSASKQCRYANGAGREIEKRYSDWLWSVPDCNDGHVHTSPVRSYKKNKYGLHDVLGNVCEWVEDCWNDSYRGAPADGSAWESGNCSRRVLRGGAWLSGPRALRSAFRDGDGTGGRVGDAGFRVARTLTP